MNIEVNDAMALDARLVDAKTNRECLTSSQARQHSDLSNVYLAQLLRKGTLEGFKIDREWFIYTDSLEHFLAKNRKPGPRGPRKPPPEEDTDHANHQSLEA
jgi:hypothetical protein